MPVLPLLLGLQACWLFENNDDDDDDEPTVELIEYEVPAPRYFVSEAIPVNRIDTSVNSLPANSTFTILPAPVQGLTFDSATGDISGTAEVTSAPVTHAVEATQSGLVVGRGSVTITIVDAVPPSNLTYSQNPATYIDGQLITPNEPSYNGIADTFSVAPPLPNDLRISASSGRISGIPRVQSPATLYTVTASNAYGSTSVDVSIAVLPTLSANRLLVSDGAEPLLLTCNADRFPGNVYPLGYESLAASAVDVTSTPLGDRVFVLDQNGDIHAFTPVPNSTRLTSEGQVGSVSNGQHLAVSASGTRLLVLAGGSLTIFDIGALGSLSGQETVAAAVAASDLLTHASADFAYVANGFGGGLSVYSFTGALTALPGSVPVVGFAEHLSAPADGSRLHVGETNNGDIYTFAIDLAGANAAAHLTPLGAATRVPGGQIDHLLASPDGAHVFASTAFNASIEAFRFDTGLGALVHNFSTQSMGYLTDLAIAPDSRLLHVLDPVQREVEVYRVGPGALTWTDRSRTRQSPSGLHLVRGAPIFVSTDLVLVSNETASALTVVELDRTANTLTAGTPVNSGNSPQRPVVNNPHDLAYVPVAGASSVEMYAVDGTNRTLLPATPPSVASGEVPRHLALGAAGRFAYVVDAIGGLIVHPVSPTTGALAAGVGQVTIAMNAGPVVVDPTGQFLYLLEPGTNQVASYALDLVTGMPTLIGRTGTQPSPIDLAVAPQGAEVYVASSGASLVSALAIDPLDGSLTAHGTDSPVDTMPLALDIMHQGFNMYTGSSAAASITILNVDFATGVPQPFPAGVSPVAIGAGLDDLRVDHGDLFVFASLDGASPQLIVLRGQPTESLLQVGTTPLAAGRHRLGLNAR